LRELVDVRQKLMSWFLVIGSLNSIWQFTGYAQYCHFFHAVSHGNKKRTATEASIL
jgi:hypothetical protein